jgi:hypothetical protein
MAKQKQTPKERETFYMKAVCYRVIKEMSAFVERVKEPEALALAQGFHSLAVGVIECVERDLPFEIVLAKQQMLWDTDTDDRYAVDD